MLSENHCFFCDQTDNVRNLHAASTFEVDQKVRKSAVALKDSRLLANLSAGDMIAMEARYHAKCLVGLYNRARMLIFTATKDTTTSVLNHDKLVFAVFLI